MSEKEEKLKKLLKETVETPASNFTSSVLSKIEQEEALFTSALQKARADEVSVDFTDSVLASLPKKRIKPIGLKWFWITFVPFSLAVVLMLVFSSTEKAQLTELSDYDLHIQMPEMSSIFMYLSMALITVSFYLLVEHYIQRKRSNG